MKILIFINLTLYSFFLCSQESSNEYSNQLFIIEGDSIPVNGISLKEVIVFLPLKFESHSDLLNYILLKRKTLKVYPFAKLAADRLIILNNRLDNIKSKRNRKKYVKMMEDFIYDEFETELRKLSRSEGNILIRLINRQTGNTAYDLIKELRTGFRAFIYQTTASFFKLSLKETFDPENDHQDYLVEDIIQRAFANKDLEEQQSALNYNLEELFYNWKKKKENLIIN
jgi:hypothetical protein|tara:strand:+ start:186 stop:866 length:681 start_codon:yes stop_codon:yes gene_type:complete